MEESDNFEHFLTYDMADGWISLADATENPDYDGVYYRELVDEKSMEEAVQGLHVIADDVVYVQDSVTRIDLQMLAERYESGDGEYPTLTVTAYAVQREGFDEAEDAWFAAIDAAGIEVEEEDQMEESDESVTV